MNTSETSSSDESLKTFNITVNPLLVPFGFFDGEFDFGVTDSMTLGIYTSIFRYNSGDSNFSWTGIGGRLNYYLNHQRLTDGWYLSPYAQTIFTSSNYNSYSFGGLMGHQWVFRTGFNILLGAGLSYYTAKNKSAPISSGLWPIGEFRLGYTF